MARYDLIGRTYSRYRRPDPSVAAAIADAVGPADRIVDVGSGTGSYAPSLLAPTVLAVEPSATMIRQRPPSAPPVVRAVAEDLPFPARSFDVALAILTVHHWTDPAQGLAEMRRVADRLVILTWDPEVYRRFWLLDEYIPELADTHSGRGAVQDVLSLLPGASVSTLAVRSDCMDGFGAAYWRRPHMYLDPDARQAISGFALCAPGIVDAAMTRLAEDLQSGVWASRHGRLLELDEIDAGYRLVVTDRQRRRQRSGRDG